MKNNKGFTLVELLAVIVILALVMGIASVSMTSVLSNSRISSMKSSATSFVSDMPTLLLGNGDSDTGYYYISDSMLQQGGKSSPWGTYQYNTTATSASNGYKHTTATLTCGGTDALTLNADGKGGSFVYVEEVNGKNVYTICLYDEKGHYIYADAETLTTSDAEENTYYIVNSSNKTITRNATTKVLSISE